MEVCTNSVTQLVKLKPAGKQPGDVDLQMWPLLLIKNRHQSFDDRYKVIFQTWGRSVMLKCWNVDKTFVQLLAKHLNILPCFVNGLKNPYRSS